MRSFTLRLLDAVHAEEIAGVTSFVAEDTSGRFGILAGHVRMMTTLVVGLARFRGADEVWRYLALPGAVLYFHDNLLTVSSRHYLLDDNYMRISQALQAQLLEEKERLQTMKESLHHMEEEIFKHLWKRDRKGTD